MRKLAFLAALSSLFICAGASAQARYVPGIRVTVAPPALRHEAVPVAPSARHLWIAGHWAWRGNAHLWMPGHWTMPPNPGYAWQPARWENVNGAWMFYEGHWRSSEQPQVTFAYQPAPPPVNQVVVETEPPAPIVEVRPAEPFPAAVWMPGYWHWSGRQHVWVSGRWSPRPEGYEWQEHRWEHRHDGRWAYQPGHWHPQERHEEREHHEEHDHHEHDRDRHP